jgi:DNA-binding NarL/FixJ family response regulator
MRVVLAEDSGLLRETLSRALRAGGFELVAAVGDADSLETAVRERRPDVLLTDVRMPPGDGPAGLTAALRLRAEDPSLGILVLSTYASSDYVRQLTAQGARGVGYLLKDRVSNVRVLLDCVRRVGEGGTALDPEVVKLMLDRPRDDGLAELSGRERDILSLVAQGLSNGAIAAQLFVSDKTVETHMAHILLKLDLPPDPDQNRRVAAVLRYLREG